MDIRDIDRYMYGCLVYEIWDINIKWYVYILEYWYMYIEKYKYIYMDVWFGGVHGGFGVLSEGRNGWWMDG